MTIPSIMEVAANALRGIIISPPGRKLISADLSNIEGRGIAWLAGEEWKLRAFRAFDGGVGPDIYKRSYADSFHNTPDDVTKYQRQIGKGLELSMGYEGGVGAFLKIAASYGLDIEQLTEVAYDLIPAHVKAEALKAYEWASEKRRTYGLTMRQYIVCDALKRMWRAAHPAIVKFWKDLKEAATRTILTREPCQVGVLRFDMKGSWLRIALPSTDEDGNPRYLNYPSAKVGEDGTIYYWGEHQYTRRWQKLSTYGGKLAENATQALARDVMADAMPVAEAAGYKVVLTVHDEIVTETPDTDEYSAEGLAAIMATVPPWAPGLPLAAAGEESYRYGK